MQKSITKNKNVILGHKYHTISKNINIHKPLSQIETSKPRILEII